MAITTMHVTAKNLHALALCIDVGSNISRLMLQSTVRVSKIFKRILEDHVRLSKEADKINQSLHASYKHESLLVTNASTVANQRLSK